MKKVSLVLVFSCIFMACKTDKTNPEEAEDINEEITTQVQRQSGDSIAIKPISHATAVINWGDLVVYLDPVGGADVFQGNPRADLVLITDIHQDHMDAETLQNLGLGNTKIIAPRAVQEALPESLHSNIQIMNNDEVINEQGLQIRAIPMYNLREEAKEFHPQGRGNGYVLEMNGKRLYIAGDTEDIPEMRKLQNIDIALVPMNLPYTMNIETAADAVADFKPEKVYPYHYRGQNGKADVEKFKSLVNEKTENVEVILAEWYPNE